MPKPESAFIVLFREVGGASQLQIAQLRPAQSEAGYENAAKYINDSNAVVRRGLTKS